MERNIPSELIRDYHKTESSLVSNVILEKEFMQESPALIDENRTEKRRETPMRDCKKILFNEPEVCPAIPLIDKDEFSKIPKYIIGRQSLETVNNFINIINQILRTKYTFLSLGKAHARKQGELNLYLHFKKQEMDICNDNGKFFFLIVRLKRMYFIFTKGKNCCRICILFHWHRLRKTSEIQIRQAEIKSNNGSTSLQTIAGT